MTDGEVDPSSNFLDWKYLHPLTEPPMSTYSELLKDPRWQKKRLEILQLDHWQCRKCNDKNNTLHVHHLYYIKGNNPWEYENDALITLCEDCHGKAASVNWQQAFLDLNMSEFDLLELAIRIKFRKKKFDEASVELYEKHKCRLLYFYMCYDLFSSDDEVSEYYSGFRNENIAKYNG